MKWRRLIHRWIAHPLCRVLVICGHPRLGFKIHDATFPEVSGHLWSDMWS